MEIVDTNCISISEQIKVETFTIILGRTANIGVEVLETRFLHSCTTCIDTAFDLLEYRQI